MFKQAGSLVAATLLMSTISGCSWAFMTKPPTVVAAPNHPVDCTTSVAAPVLDTVCAGYFILNGIVLATGNYSSSTQSGGIALSAGLTLLCGLSAGYGYSSANRCRQVKDLNALCIAGEMGACTQLRSDWMPAPGSSSSRPAQLPSGALGGGCMKDTDCKGDRVCERGTCVSPADNRSPEPTHPPPHPEAPTQNPHACERDADCDRGICFDGVCRE